MYTLSSREMPYLCTSLNRVEACSQAVPAKIATHIPEMSSAHHLIKRHISFPSPALISLLKHPIGVEKREASYTVGGNVNWYSHYGEQYGGSLKN